MNPKKLVKLTALDKSIFFRSLYLIRIKFKLKHLHQNYFLLFIAFNKKEVQNSNTRVSFNSRFFIKLKRADDLQTPESQEMHCLGALILHSDHGYSQFNIKY